MYARFGSQEFRDVTIPLLWGKRAVIGHFSGELSIIDLGESDARIEVVADKPWTNIETSIKEDGFIVYKDSEPVFFFSPARKILRDLEGLLPECEISDEFTRVGSNKLIGGSVSGFQVGIGVSENEFFMGGPMPEGLAKLVF